MSPRPNSRSRDARQESRRAGRFDIDPQLASESMNVAMLYAGRDEIIGRLSWDCLVRLASPALPSQARQNIEAKVGAGQKIVASDIVRARGTRRPADQAARRMAA